MIVEKILDEVKQSSEDVKVATKKIDKINSELSISENTKYQTVNGTKEFTSKAGYIDNIVIEGKTVLNIVDKLHRITGGNDSDNVVRTRLSPINDTYESNRRLSTGTWTFYNMTDNHIQFVGVNQNNEWVLAFVVDPHSHNTMTFDGSTAVVGVDFRPGDGWSNSDLSIYNEKMLMVVKGEHGKLPYFKGIHSIGQNNNIELLSYETNDNLLLSVTCIDGLEDGSNTDKYKITDFIPVNEGDAFYSYDTGTFLLYNSSKTKIGHSNSKEYYVSNKDIKFIRKIITKSNINSFLLKNSKYDKKYISTTLRGLSDIKDTSKPLKIGDKYYMIKNISEYIITGDETIEIFTVGESTIIFAIKCNKEKIKLKDNSICNRFECVRAYNTGYEHFYLEQDLQINIEIIKARLETQDINGIRKWLKENLTVIDYELEHPILIELPNYSTKTFENKTTLLINSDILQAEAEFEVTNSLGSSMDVMSNKLSSLDNSVQEATNKAEQAFQYGNKVKGDLVDKLISIGNEASTNETFEQLIDKIKATGRRWIEGSLPSTTVGNNGIINIPFSVDFTPTLVLFKVTTNAGKGDTSSSYSNSGFVCLVTNLIVSSFSGGMTNARTGGNVTVVIEPNNIKATYSTYSTGNDRMTTVNTDKFYLFE